MISIQIMRIYGEHILKPIKATTNMCPRVFKNQETYISMISNTKSTLKILTDKKIVVVGSNPVFTIFGSLARY